MKSFLFSFFFLFSSFLLSAQVGIGTTNPNASSMLDITSTNSGLLIPRIALTSSTDTVTIPSPVASLLVYNTGAGGLTPAGYYYWNGSAWITLAGSGGSDWTITGNSGTTAGTNFIGTADAVDLRIKTGGNDRLNISNTNGQLQSYNTTGSAATPSYSFSGTQISTGMFNPAADNLGFSSGGTERFRIPNANQVHAMSLGTAALPFYSFSGQASTGMFGVGTDNLAFSTAGTERARIESDGDVGIGVTPDVSAKLDVSAANKGFLAPRVALTSTILAGPIVTPATGLLVYNTAIAGTAPNNVVPGYYYNSGTTVAPVWKRFSAGNGDSWQTTGNTGTTAGTNYIGTNDAQDFVVKTNTLERMRVTSGGLTGLGTTTPITTTSNYLLTVTPSATIQSGINIPLAGATATATGLNITANNAFVNGITVDNSSSALTSSFFGIGGILSSTNIVSGYNGYRTASGSSYGLYGVNGTPGTYATNASTWAGFLQGRTVISSEAAPTSTLGTDLEVRNTTTGAAAPATVSMRQTTSLATAGNVLANLNFGDNYVTTPQAQIQILRDLAAGSAADMPTAMAFSTTPDASATLTERMRITNSGTIGVGTTNPQAALDINSSNNGILIPRVALLVGANSSSPVTTITDSEVIYNTASVGAGINAVTPGFYHWNTATTRWVRFNTGAATGWLTTGNSGLTAGTNFIGTTDNVDVSFKRSSTAAGFIGANSTAFGVSSLAANAGSNNTAFGTNALAANNTPGDNTAIGYNALAANTLNSGAGNLNTAVGSGALAALNGGAKNTAVGAGALAGVNTNAALDNVAVGWNALPGSGTITQSVAVGSGALSGSGSATTRSTAVGFNAGNNVSLSIDSVFIGTNALGTGPTATNQIAIGSGATASGDNDIRLGNTAIDYAGIQVAWTITSDRRWKNNIKDSGLGLNFLKTLRPVSYIRNNDIKGKTEYGFIAQELEDAFNKAGDTNNAVISKDDKGMYGVRYNDFIAITVKAVQEQQEEIEALKKQNAELIKTNEVILKRLEALEKK